MHSMVLCNAIAMPKLEFCVFSVSSSEVGRKGKLMTDVGAGAAPLLVRNTYRNSLTKKCKFTKSALSNGVLLE